MAKKSARSTPATGRDYYGNSSPKREKGSSKSEKPKGNGRSTGTHVKSKDTWS